MAPEWMSLTTAPNVFDQPPLSVVGWIGRLRGRLPSCVPSGKYQNGWITLQHLGEDFRALDTQAHATILNCRNGGLCDAIKLTVNASVMFTFGLAFLLTPTPQVNRRHQEKGNPLQSTVPPP
jgi:hypothetical protein